MDPCNFSCIYLIINVTNGHLYIGSTAHYGNRASVHRANLKAGNHHSSYLQRAYNRYGSESFKFIVLEVVVASRLIQREKFWMKKLRPEYNLAPVAGSVRGFKHGPETRKKMSDGARRWANTPEERERRSQAAKKQHAAGRFGDHVVSAETRAKIGRPGHPPTRIPTSEQARAMQAARKSVGGPWGTFPRKVRT